jgi:hypothetical protein
MILLTPRAKRMVFEQYTYQYLKLAFCYEQMICSKTYFQEDNHFIKHIAGETSYERKMGS